MINNSKIILAGLANNTTSLGEVFRRYYKCFKSFSDPDVYDLGQQFINNPEFRVEHFPQFKGVIDHDIKLIMTTLDMYGQMKQLDRKVSPPVHPSKKIGMFLWESTILPKRNRTHFDDFDEIWTATQYCKDIFSQYTDSNKIKIATLPIPDPIREYAKFDRFTILIMGNLSSSIDRKNIIGNIKAAITLKTIHKDIDIIFKTTSSSTEERIIIRNLPNIDKIHVIDEYYNYSQVEELIGNCHVILSLHRSEGFGLTLAEAMTVGTLPICTGYSGNIDFMKNKDLLVDYKLIDCQSSYFEGQWAEPDIDDAISKISYFIKNGISDTIIQDNKKYIEDHNSYDVVSEILHDHINDVSRTLQMHASKLINPIKQITIGIPVIGNIDALEKCMNSLSLNDEEFSTDFVIVNNSINTDDNIALYELCKNYNCKIIEHHLNLGVARSWNMILEYAYSNNKTPYIVGSDTECVHGLSNIYRFIESEPDKMWMVKGMNFFYLPSSFSDIIGLFDESFYPAYYEDCDYHMRIRSSGHGDMLSDVPRHLVNYEISHIESNTIKKSDLLLKKVINRGLTHNHHLYVLKWGGAPGQETYTNPFNNPVKSSKFASKEYESNKYIIMPSITCGLGDAIIMYFALEPNMEYHVIKLNKKIILSIESHNKYSKELYSMIPYIDEDLIYNPKDQLIEDGTTDGDEFDANLSDHTKYTDISEKGFLDKQGITKFSRYDSFEILSSAKIYPSIKDREIIDSILSLNKPIIVISPGASDGYRTIPVEILNKIVDSINGEEYTIVLIGKNNSNNANPEISSTAYQDRIVNIVDKLTVHGTLQLIRSSAGLITSDSSTLICGTLLFKPMLVIIPSKNDKKYEYTDNLDHQRFYGQYYFESFHRNETVVADFSDFSEDSVQRFINLTIH